MTLPFSVRFDRKALLSLAVGIPLAAALLYFALRGVDLAQVWERLRSANRPLAALGFLTLSAAYAIRAWRWRMLLNAEGSLRFDTVFWAMSLGYLGNNLLPARMGELVRTGVIAWKGRIGAPFVLVTALTERLLDAGALVLVASIALATVPAMPEWLRKAALGLSVGAVVGVAALAVLPRIEPFLLRCVGALPGLGRLRKRLQSLTSQLLLGMRPLHDTGRAAGFTLCTAVIWSLDTLVALALARSMSIEMSPMAAIIVLAALGLASSLPSTPGYLGIYQFVAVSVLPPFGVTAAAALAFVLLLQAVIYLVSIVFGVLGVFALGGSRHAEAVRDPAQPVSSRPA